MSLSVQQRKELQEALIYAFPTKPSLEQMLSYELDKNLRAIAGEGSLQNIVFKLIQTADAEGWVRELIKVTSLSITEKLDLNIKLTNEAVLSLSKKLKIFKNKLIEESNLSKLKNIKKEIFQELSQPDFALSTLWSFYHCSRLLEKLLNDRQCEEWIGDLEEVLYKMHDRKYPKWQLHFETLRRTFDILKGIFITKLNPSSSERKSIK